MSNETKLAKKCQSDYVRFVIDLAYLPEKEARALDLTTEKLMERVQERKNQQEADFQMIKTGLLRKLAQRLNRKKSIHPTLLERSGHSAQSSTSIND